jgi:hypothetical protein
MVGRFFPKNTAFLAIFLDAARAFATMNLGKLYRK